MNLGGCSHLMLYKKNPENRKSFKWIHAVFVVGTNNSSRQKRICNAYCRICKKRGPYLHACLECVFFGCLKHIREHEKNHTQGLSMDLTYGQIHCNSCGDYVYDSDMESLMNENKMIASSFRKRLFDSTGWNPTDEELAYLKSKTKKICITPDSTIGLRGLKNLGATCFLNCIVQALMHTPLLRDYFLSKCHNCKAKSGTCLVCEISELFQEFYQCATAPLVLDKLLHAIWLHAKHLAGYKQQDAQEFFIWTLDILHSHCSEALPSALSHKIGSFKKCSCIIDQIFIADMQKDVVCQNCNSVSTSIEHTSNVSLDITNSSFTGEEPSLKDCLEHFTRVEYLEDKSVRMCSLCQSLQKFTIQSTIKTLPIVASFHLKRFLYSKELKMLKKISTTVSYPEMLDMTPFIIKSESNSPFPSDNRYTLFAVITHVGDSLDEGHYIAYVRQQNDYWYKCDDEVVTQTNIDDVLKSEGYLLFYHKHVLNYD